MEGAKSSDSSNLIIPFDVFSSRPVYHSPQLVELEILSTVRSLSACAPQTTRRILAACEFAASARQFSSTFPIFDFPSLFSVFRFPAENFDFSPGLTGEKRKRGKKEKSRILARLRDEEMENLLENAGVLNDPTIPEGERTHWKILRTDGDGKEKTGKRKNSEGPETHRLLIVDSFTGNCLCHAASLALWGIHDRREFLRDSIRKMLENPIARHKFETAFINEQCRTLELNRDDEDSLTALRREFDELVDRLKNPSAYLEPLHIFVLAHVLRRPIIVLGEPMIKVRSTDGVCGESVNSCLGIFLPLFESSTIPRAKPAIVLAHSCEAAQIGQGHFSACVFTEGQFPEPPMVPLFLRDQKTQATTMMKIRFLSPQLFDPMQLLFYYLELFIPAPDRFYARVPWRSSDGPDLFDSLWREFLEAADEGQLRLEVLHKIAATESGKQIIQDKQQDKEDQEDLSSTADSSCPLVLTPWDFPHQLNCYFSHLNFHTFLPDTVESFVFKALRARFHRYFLSFSPGERQAGIIINQETIRSRFKQQSEETLEELAQEVIEVAEDRLGPDWPLLRDDFLQEVRNFPERFESPARTARALEDFIQENSLLGRHIIWKFRGREEKTVEPFALEEKTMEKRRSAGYEAADELE